MTSFKLFDFNIADVELTDGDDPFVDHKQFIIQAFVKLGNRERDTYYKLYTIS